MFQTAVTSFEKFASFLIQVEESRGRALEFCVFTQPGSKTEVAKSGRSVLPSTADITRQIEHLRKVTKAKVKFTGSIS